MDGCGAGATPDAAEFGDLDSPSTIRKTWEIVKGIKAPTLINAGFFTACGWVPPKVYLASTLNLVACYLCPAEKTPLLATGK